jgi:hypothetical protein
MLKELRVNSDMNLDLIAPLAVFPVFPTSAVVFRPAFFLIQFSLAFVKTVPWFSHEISLYLTDHYLSLPAIRRREGLLAPNLL